MILVLVDLEYELVYILDIWSNDLNLVPIVANILKAKGHTPKTQSQQIVSGKGLRFVFCGHDSEIRIEVVGKGGSVRTKKTLAFRMIVRLNKEKMMSTKVGGLHGLGIFSS